MIVRNALDDILGSTSVFCWLAYQCTKVASNFGFASSQGELPDRFWRELSDASSVVCEKLLLDAKMLAAIEAVESTELDDIDAALSVVKNCM